MYKGFSVDLPCGLGGLNGNKNFFQVPVTDLIEARNIRFDGFTWTKVGGLKLLDANTVNANALCLGGFDWRPLSGTRNQVTVWDDGTIYKESGSDLDATTLASGLTFTDPVSLVEGSNISSSNAKNLYMFSRNVFPQVLVNTGTSMSNIGGPSTDWSSNYPAAAVYHDARIFAYDLDSAPHNFYISSLNDHGDFTLPSGGRVFSIAPGQGDRIACMFSYLPTILYAFKYPRGIWQIDTTNITGFYMPINLVRDDVGVAGPHAVTKVGNDVIFISATGMLYSLTALSSDVDPKDADITARFNLTQFIRDNVNISRLKWARLVYDESRKELHYFYTSNGGSSNDRVLTLDFTQPGVPKMSYDDRGSYYNATWKYIDSSGNFSLLTAGEGGLVYEMNDADLVIGASTAYTGAFRYPDTDLKFIDPKMQSVKKRFDFLEVSIVPTGDYNLSFQIYIDSETNSTKSVNLGSQSSAIGTAMFGTATFAGDSFVTHRVPIDAVGTTIGIRGYNSGTDEGFKIANIRLYFSVNNQEYEA